MFCPEKMQPAKLACQSTSKSRAKVSDFGTPPPHRGSHLRGYLRWAVTLDPFGVGGRAKSRPATITLTKTVTLNALSRCFICHAQGIMLNSNYGM